MPRKPNLALAVCVAVALTLGVGAAYVAVDARPASPVLSAAAASSVAAADTCAPKYRVRKTRLGLNRFGSQGFGRVPVVRNWDTHGELRSSGPCGLRPSVPTRRRPATGQRPLQRYNAAPPRSPSRARPRPAGSPCAGKPT